MAVDMVLNKCGEGMTRQRCPGKEQVVDPPSKPVAVKKRKTAGISIREPMEEEREVQEEPYVMKHGDIPYRGMWVQGSLSKLPMEVQPELFYEKVMLTRLRRI
ncbi:hypothetical protein HanIR_Chr02g0079991 [Helianthus annuus]|nr:hypothetical protein HanIR_Chr02g0079991 [Helianthus annuus]